MTRNGKIARLPRDIRDELNSRLDDGEDGPQLLDWLNSLPEVDEVLQSHFAGVPISPQNLSEWRQGGFREWEVRQEFLYHAHDLAASSRDMAETIDPPQLACDLAAELAVRFAALLHQWDGENALEFADKLHVLHGLARDISLIQRIIERATRYNTEFAQQVEDRDERNLADAKKHAINTVMAPRMRGTLVELFGGGEYGEKIADFVTAIKYDLPLPKKDEPTASNPPPLLSTVAPAKAEALAKAGQTKSNQIKPLPPSDSSQGGPAAPKPKAKAGQTKSNQIKLLPPESSGPAGPPPVSVDRSCLDGGGIALSGTMM